ncbi:MAG: RNA polymerase sigma factor [Fimbriiglobus sp.]
MTATTDEELAVACARRAESPLARRYAEDAFRTLYERHARRLLAFLGGRVERVVVEDVHQDVWAKVWQATPTNFHGGNFRAWLFQIARNAVVDHQRKRKPEPLGDERNLVDHRPPPRLGDIAADRRAALAKCLERLERANAKVAELVRSRVAGESYDAICARTGTPPDQAYRAFHQAKARLQACVENSA